MPSALEGPPPARRYRWVEAVHIIPLCIRLRRKRIFDFTPGARYPYPNMLTMIVIGDLANVARQATRTLSSSSSGYRPLGR